ncbi:MAG: electron transport complex subunit RsxA [Leptospirales bacterium]
MDSFIYLILISINAIFVSNIVFAQFLGICPYMGVSKKIDTALGMGMAVVFVMTLSNAITYMIQIFILEPYDIGFLKTISFILVIASLVQFVEIFMKKKMNVLYQSLGIYLPLITTNCAILGVALLAIQNEYNFIQSIVFSISSGIGFILALVLFAGIRERLEYAQMPAALKGTPVALVSAAIISLAFMGFSGLVKL